MATFTVNTLDDTTAADGLTSLREAIILANTTPGADDIVFATGLTGTSTINPVSLASPRASPSAATATLMASQT